MKNETKGKPVPVRFERPEDQFLHEAARETGISVSELIRRSVRLLQREHSKSSDFGFVLKLAA